MATTADTIFSRIRSHAGASGLFERVNTHEPKNAPGNGLTAAIWMQSIAPARGSSGLNTTTMVLTFMLRIYSNMTQAPQDYIDPNLMDAGMRMMNAYSSDFELGGNVRNIDLLGKFGSGLNYQAGYLEQDNKMFRIIDISIPVVVNGDLLWVQAP